MHPNVEEGISVTSGSYTIIMKNKEATNLSDLRAVLTFRASPSALAPSTDILLYWRLEKRHDINIV